MIQHWETVSCQKVIDVRDGTHDTPEYVQQGIPLVTSKNLVDGQIDLSTASFISLEDHEQIRKRSEVNKGDILMAMIGTIGNPVLINFEPNFSIKNVALFKFRDSTVHAPYFYYLLQSPLIEQQFEEAMRGVTQKFLSLTVLRNLQIPLPPLPEQKRIAALLAQADHARRTRRFTQSVSDTFLQEVFVEMFGDLAERWQFRKLGRLADVVSGVTKGQKFNGRKTVEVPYLRVANVQDGYLDLSEIKLIRALPSEVEKYTLQPGDVVMTEGGDYDKLGRGAIWRGEIEGCIHQNHVFRVRVDRECLLPQFFAAYLQSTEAKLYFLGASKQTTNLASINMTQLRALPVPLPPMELQRDFADTISKFERVENQQHESARQAEHLFQTLLHRAFRGEV